MAWLIEVLRIYPEEQSHNDDDDDDDDDKLFCRMADQRKAFSLFSSRDHYQRFSSSQISKWI